MSNADWLAEARQIARGQSLRMPVTAHLIAMQQHIELLERTIAMQIQQAMRAEKETA